MKRLTIILSLILSGCAGFSRSCSSDIAEGFGSDWLVVQYNFEMKPSHCWKLDDTSIANEKGSDGIYWETTKGNLVHISGWYNRVQVVNGWEDAAKDVGVELDKCKGGEYVSTKEIVVPEQEISVPEN